MDPCSNQRYRKLGVSRSLGGLSLGVLLLALTLAAPAGAQFGLAGPDIEWEVAQEYHAALPGEDIRLLFTFSIDERWHVNAHVPLEAFLIPTVLSFAEDDDRFEVVDVVYPPHKLFTFDFSDQPLAVYEDTFHIGAVLRLAEDVEPGELLIDASIRYQACDDTQCAPPRTKEMEIPIQVAAADHEPTRQHAAAFDDYDWDYVSDHEPAETEGADDLDAVLATWEVSDNWQDLADQFETVGQIGYVGSEEFIDFIARTERGEGMDDGFSLAGKSWYLVLAAILLGGLLLNLTPCVLPLIPINIAIIGAGARAGSRGRGFALGTAYGVGISFVYGMLGLVVVLGISSAFGSINASPWFNGGIAVLFVLLALAMFDIIHIDFSKYQAKFGIRGNENGSFGIALAMGCISALLAGACVAPVVISTIVYAQDLYAEGVGIALALPFMLGVGMALPWPFAGAGLSFLPKPGMWMVRVKQAFGVFILVFAAYYGYLAWSIYDERNVDPGAVAESVSQAQEDGWITSLEEGLALAKEENRPVLLDFWATWCKNCLVMNNTVLKDPDVLAAMDDFVLIKYQAEDPSRDPVKEVWEYYNLIGLPTYLVLHPEGYEPGAED